jgi:hypothetical protein
MQDALAMRMRKGERDLAQHVGDEARRQRAAFMGDLRERAARREFGDQVGLRALGAVPQQLHDAGVRQAGQQRRLVLEAHALIEPGARNKVQQFDGDRVRRIGRAGGTVDTRARIAAQGFQQLVAGDDGGRWARSGIVGKLRHATGPGNRVAGDCSRITAPGGGS